LTIVFEVYAFRSSESESEREDEDSLKAKREDVIREWPIGGESERVKRRRRVGLERLNTAEEERASERKKGDQERRGLSERDRCTWVG
jgi:hypothetical protein